jgi:ATP-dependent Zn protease
MFIIQGEFMKNKKKVLICAIIILFIIVIGITTYFVNNKNNLQYISYIEFNKDLENGNIKSAVIESDKIIFTKDSEKTYYTENPENDDLKEELLLKGVEVTKDTSRRDCSICF